MTPPRLDFDGRAAVVTGAAKGIGHAVAEMLAALGARVAVCDRDGDALSEVAPDFPVAQVLDVRNPDGVRAFAEVAGERLGRIGVLVNNAGGTYTAPFTESTERGDDALVRENLLSAVWMTRAFVPHLTVDAAVVNVTSIEARRAAPGFAVYAAAKAGLESLTRTLALELAPIRVNAVAPDVVATPGVGELADVDPPLGRAGRPAEVASVVAFLASPLASFVTGTVVPVDGGNRAAGGWRRGGGGADVGWVT